MIDFTFDKPFYNEKQLLKVIPVKRSTFYSWQSEWIAKGKDPAEMGKLIMKSKPESKRLIVYWNAPKFLTWMYQNKIIKPTTYDYEIALKEHALVVFNRAKEKHGKDK